MPTVTITDWPTVSQVARTLDVTPNRVRQFLSEGRLRYVPTGLGRLIDPASVAELSQARRVPRLEALQKRTAAQPGS